MKVTHTALPYLGDASSKYLILGSFPSVASRHHCFYYAHPNNRFWQCLATVCNAPLPQTTKQKQSLLLAHSFALYDVIESCEIEGSKDETIHAIVYFDFDFILRLSPIEHVFCNGRVAYQHFIHAFPTWKKKCTYLPSTSPRNAAFSNDHIQSHWKEKVEAVIKKQKEN